MDSSGLQRGDFFNPQVIQQVMYKTNLPATQNDIKATFTTAEDEMKDVMVLLVSMGFAEPPSVDNDHPMMTRVPQVADLMSSKRFVLCLMTTFRPRNISLDLRTSGAIPARAAVDEGTS